MKVRQHDSAYYYRIYHGLPRRLATLFQFPVVLQDKRPKKTGRIISRDTNLVVESSFHCVQRQADEGVTVQL